MTAPAPSRAARTHRAWTSAAFFTQGLVFLCLNTRLPAFQQRWGLGEATLSLLLLGMVLLAGIGSLAAERLATRSDSATLLRVGLGVIAVTIPVVGLAPAFWVFATALGAYGIGLGIVDATSNMQAVAIEHDFGRPLLPSFHGAWTLGGVVGSALTLLLPRLALGLLGLVAVVPLCVLLGRFRPRATLVDVSDVFVPWRPILLVGLALTLFYMVDTAAQVWGAPYLAHTVRAPAHLVALAAFPYLLASGAVRLLGDRLVERLGAVPVLRVGAIVAAAALAGIVFAPDWRLAVVCFAVLGAGAAVIAPLSFSAAARIAGGDALDPDERMHRVDAVIARFNQFNYVGALVGAVLTGLVGAHSLRYGFVLPMVLILGLVPLARAFVAAGRGSAAQV